LVPGPASPGVHALDDQVERFVGGDYVPLSVHDERWVRQMTFEDMVDRGAHRGQGRVVEGGLRIGGCVPGRQEQLVALSQREFERLGQAYDDVPAGGGPAGLDEAEVPLGRACPQSEIKLAEMAAGAAFAQRVREVHVPL